VNPAHSDNNSVTKSEKEEEEMTSFVDLPNEIIDLILSHLDFSNRSHARVNKKLAEIESKMKMEKEKGGKWSDVEILTLPFPSFHRLFFSSPCSFRLSSYLTTVGLERMAKNVQFGVVKLTIEFMDNYELEFLRSFVGLSIAELEIKYESMLDRRGRRKHRGNRIDASILCDLLKTVAYLEVDSPCRELCLDDITLLKQAISSTVNSRVSLVVSRSFARQISEEIMGVEFNYFETDSRPHPISRTNRSIEVLGEVGGFGDLHLVEGTLETSLLTETIDEKLEYTLDIEQH
ncbi:hypothetical protein PFISCL1PPCAC_24540, partial [Pristionchus fissidentatus]